MALPLSICWPWEDDLDRLAIDRMADEQLPFAQAYNCRAIVLIQESVVWRVDLGGASAPDDLGSAVARYSLTPGMPIDDEAHIHFQR